MVLFKTKISLTLPHKRYNFTENPIVDIGRNSKIEVIILRDLESSL